MVASCGVMANGGARSFSYIKAGGWVIGIKRRHIQNSQWQTQPNMMQFHSNTLQRGILLLLPADVNCIKPRHSKPIEEVVSKGHLNLHTHALHSNWRISSCENFQYIQSCGQGQQWIEFSTFLCIKARSAPLPRYLLACDWIDRSQLIQIRNSKSISIMRW